MSKSSKLAYYQSICLPEFQQFAGQKITFLYRQKDLAYSKQITAIFVAVEQNSPLVLRVKLLAEGKTEISRLQKFFISNIEFDINDGELSRQLYNLKNQLAEI